MLLVKDFKVQLSATDKNKWEARAWNAHSQFVIESESPHYAIHKAVQGCLEYHAARHFESAYIIKAGTDEIVYKNLACLEFERSLGVECIGEVSPNSNTALVMYKGEPAQLDFEVEWCHGYGIVRIVAVRFLSIVRR